MSQAVKHASQIVNYIRKSVLDTQIVADAVGFRIPSMNATRWNSQYYMLQKLVDALQSDPSLQSRLNAVKKLGRLSNQEVKTLNELVLILEIFEEATNEFQADYETVGTVIPAFLDLKAKTSLTTVESNGRSIQITSCRNVIRGLNESLVRRFSHVMYDPLYVLGIYS